MSGTKSHANQGSGKEGKRKVSRRDFLKLSAAVLGSVALDPIIVKAKVFSVADAPPDGAITVDEDNGIGSVLLEGPIAYWWQRDEASCVGGKMRFTHNTPISGPTPMNWAIWETLPLPVDGKYTIVAYIPLENATTTGANYQIRDTTKKVISTYVVDQSANKGKWVEIAKGIDYKAGDIGGVYVDDVVPEAPDARWAEIGVDAMVWLPPGVNWNPGPNLIAYDPRRAQLGLPTWCGIAGEPVAASLGYFYTQHRDLFVPGPGLSVEITRAYNSLNTKQGLFGRGWTCLYDMNAQDRGNGEIIVTFANGRAGLYVPSGGGYTRPPSFFADLEKQGDGWLLKDVNGTRYTFDGRGKLTEITDPNNNAIKVAYEQMGFKITDAVGRDFTVQNNGNGYIKSITDPIGRTYSYVYDGDKLTKFTDAENGSIQYAYDGENRMVSITDPNGHTFISNEYDGEGRVVTQRDASGTESSFTYDGQRTIFTDNLGHQTIYEFDAELRLVTETDHLGRSLVYVYDDQNNRISTKDREGHETKMKYDERGNVLQVIDALGQESVFEYNELNKITYKRDASGAETTYKYDNLGFNLVMVTDALGEKTRMDYFENGLLKKLTNPKNVDTDFTYDSHGYLETVTDALAHVTRYEHDGAGRRTKMTDANDHTVQFGYDGNDRVRVITDPKGNTTQFTYDAVGNLKLSIDRRGFPTRYEYNENDSLVKVTDQRGYSSFFEYDALYHRKKFINRRGFPTRYEYNEVYDLIKVLDAKNSATRFEYDADHNLLLAIDALNGETRYEYDTLHRLKKTTDAMGGVTEYQYDQVGRVKWRKDPNGAETSYEYDLLGRMKLVTDALGHKTEFKYDAAGNREQMINARGFSTEYRYNDINQLVEQIDPLKHVSQWEYDGVGNVFTLTDRRGNKTQFAYDENDNLQKITDALGGEASFAYDAEDHQISATDQNGHTRSFTYDKAGNLTSVKLPLGQITRFAYDQNGNRTREINAKKHATNFEYDPLDLLAKRTTQMGHETSYRYDRLKRMTKVFDAEGNPTDYDYDPLGRMVAVKDALDHLTRYEYDAVGNLRKHIDARGNATVFEVDVLGRTTGERDAEGHTWAYGYDEVGNKTERTDANEKLTKYEFDKDNRLIQIVYPDGSTAGFEYDENDNLVDINDASGAEKFSYDALNRLTRARRMADILKNKAVEYEYDKVGNRTLVKYPEKSVVTYEYNPNDWLVKVITPRLNPSKAPGVYTYRRDDLGLPTRINYPNATWATYAYDNDERLVRLFNGKPKASTDLISSFEYTLDKVGNRRRSVEQLTRGQVVTWTKEYEYDRIYRLRKATETPDRKPFQVLTSEFDYDEVGNRTRQTTNIADKPNTPALPGPKTTEYGYDRANRLHKAGDTIYRYDANGNRTEMSGPERAVEYTYDYENRLTGAQVYDVLNRRRNLDSTLDFTYDALGRRRERGIIEKGTRKTQDYLYDGLGYDLLGQYVKPGSPRTTYYYRDPQQVLGRHEMQGLGVGLQYFHHYDGLGSVSAWTNHIGREVHEYTYAPFGRLIDNNGSDNSSNKTNPHNALAFSGKLWDPDTELNYFGARDYDPAVGVWLTQDPYRGRLNEPMTLHRYGYVMNNPLNYYDPYGYWGESLTNVWNSASNFVSNTANSIGTYANEHKTEFVRGVAIGAAVVAATAITVATCGTGAPAAAVIIGATLAGAGAATVSTAATNVSLGRNWNQDIVQNTLIGGSVGLVIGTGGALLQYGVSGTLASLKDAATLITKPIGNQWQMAGEKFFWNPVKSFSSYWRYSGGAGRIAGQINGNSLQHLFFQSASKWIPIGLRNAGFNLLELPFAINHWAGGIFWREMAIRLGVLQLGAYAAYSGWQLGEMLAKQFGWDRLFEILSQMNRSKCTTSDNRYGGSGSW